MYQMRSYACEILHHNVPHKYCIIYKKQYKCNILENIQALLQLNFQKLHWSFEQKVGKAQPLAADLV